VQQKNLQLYISNISKITSQIISSKIINKNFLKEHTSIYNKKMKKIIFPLLLVLMVQTALGKKVKFAVDMGSYTISPFGIHVLGDFQVAAGYPLNFDPGSIQMMQEGTSSIYTVIVNIPAFQKYEYKFVNGDQTYEVEFVPEQSRVGYNFNDNRWLYVDSLQNDTTFVGAILFDGNAPIGKTLLRYVVDMQNAGPIAPTGVHLGSTFQGFNPQTHKMCNLDGTKYEIIAYLNTGLQQFRFYNGNGGADSETVPISCATSGNRTHSLTADTVLEAVCFSDCIACPPVGLQQKKIEFASLKLFPQPATDFVSIQLPATGSLINLSIVEVSGRIIDEIKAERLLNQVLILDVSKYSKGVYQIYLQSGSEILHSKLLKQ
jgi:hypothetical protein